MAAERIGMSLQGARIAIQGLGNVGSAAAELFAEEGSRLVAVQDHTGTIINEGGFDVPKLLEHVQRHGGVGGFEGAESAPWKTSG